MRISIKIIFFLIGTALLFGGIIILPNDIWAILFFLGFWSLWYSHALIVTEVDRKKRLSKARIELPLWEKRLLFPWQPNKFTKKTIIAQRIWTYFSLIVIVIYVFTWWHPGVIAIGIMIQIPLIFILSFTCEMRTRK